MILGIFTTANIPNPIVRLIIINIKVINPIKLDLITFIIIYISEATKICISFSMIF